MRAFAAVRVISQQRKPLLTSALVVPCGAAGAWAGWALAERSTLPSRKSAENGDGRQGERTHAQQFVNSFIEWTPWRLASASTALASSCLEGAKMLQSRSPIQCETSEQGGHAEIASAGTSSSEWPIITLEEVRKHVSADSIWVTHEGGVYDVTQFVAEHPGGQDLLLSAAGLDMAPFWDCYKVHGRSDYARGFLESYKIGELSPADSQAATADWEGQHAASIERSKEIYRRRWWPVMAVMLVMPYLFLLRKLVQLLGLFCPPIATWIADRLPISVPGCGSGSKRCHPTAGPGGRKLRVAVIGGGIAGCSCAYALESSGFDAEVYEARAKLGGNARVIEWSTRGIDGSPVRSDMTALFWCPEFYKNYVALIKRLGASFNEFWMPYILHSSMRGKSEFLTCNASPGHQDLQPNLRDHFASDLRIWDRVIGTIRFVENLTTWDTRPSYYKQGGWLAMFNPFNFVSAHTVLRCAGMSQECWDEIIEPLHALNLSQVGLSRLPAVVLPLLDATAPINHTRTGWSWGVGNSEMVFQKLTENVKVNTWTRVLGVDVKESGQLLVKDDQGDEKLFDRVVFACPASACANVLRPAGWLEETFMRAVRYEDDDHRDFMQAVVHQDPNVLPETERKALLRDSCFLLDIAPDQQTGLPLCETTHNLGPWPPAMQALGGVVDKDGVMQPPPSYVDNPPVMLSSHCLHPGKTVDESKVLLRHDYGRSHPTLRMENLMLISLMPLVQGRRGIYYASNWVLPGNGHDLSCISGLAAATSIGAEYPFQEEPLAKLDFQRLRRMIGMDDNQRIPWFTGLGVLAAVMAFGKS